MKRLGKRLQTLLLSRLGLRALKTVRLPSISGALLLVALVTLPSCRTSRPPQILICIGDGHGGADCDFPVDGKRYLAPSELNNFWMTSQADMARFATWCYGGKEASTEQFMEQIRSQIKQANTPHE